MFSVSIKAGTSGHYDYDNCDLLLAKIPSNNIPSVGDILQFDATNHLVREVKRVYRLETDKVGFGEYITVYVVKI